MWVRGDNKRTTIYTLIDPKSSLESISEVLGASKAHHGVVNRAVLFPLTPLLPFTGAVEAKAYI